MKPAAEFEQIDGRFEGIDELLFICRAMADETHDMRCAMLVSSVQRLSREVRSLEENLLADDLGILRNRSPFQVQGFPSL